MMHILKRIMNDLVNYLMQTTGHTNVSIKVKLL